MEEFFLSKISSEMLQFAFDNDMIDIGTIREMYEMNERKKYLQMHEYDVWQGSDGKFYTYMPDKEKGRKLKKRNTRKEIEELIIEYYKENRTMEDVFTEWSEQKLEYKEIQKQSYDKYVSDFDRFFKNNDDAKRIMKKKFRDIEEEDLEELIKKTVANMSLSQKSYSGMRLIINGVFKYGKKKKYTDISITNFMGDLDISRNSFSKKTIDPEDEVYSEEEIEILVSHLKKQTNDLKSLGLLLTFQTGVRIGELSALETVHLETKGCVKIRNTEVKIKDASGKWIVKVQGYPKTDSGYRDIILSDDGEVNIERILSISDDSGYVFSENGKRIRSNCFRRKLMVVCKQLNIKYRPNHKMRKTYGSILIDNNVDDAIVARQMGHKNIETTRKFYYYSTRGKEKAKAQIKAAIGF